MKDKANCNILFVPVLVVIINLHVEGLTLDEELNSYLMKGRKIS
jgi:hypothetical protein